MPNEFKVKNGLVVDAGGAIITGSTGITGSVSITGSTGMLGTLTVSSTIDNSLGTFTTNRVTIPNNGGNSLTVGTTTNAYRLTNAGADDNASTTIASATGNTAGTVTYGFAASSNTSQGLMFNVANGTRHITRAAIQVSGSNNTAGTEAGDLIFLTQTGGTAMSEKMRIFGGGNVAIGTTSNAGFKLDVNGTSQLNGNVTLGSSNTLTLPGAGIGSTRFVIGSSTTYNESGVGRTPNVIWATNGSNGMAFVWDRDNSRGIVLTSGNSNFQQAARASIRTVATVDTNGSEAGDLAFSTAASATLLERMRIMAGGNITIGTSVDENYRLNISGSGISGSLRIAPVFTATNIIAPSVILITGSIQQVQTASAQIYGVNIAPTMVFTTGSQTQTALRVTPTFSGSAAFTASQQNIIADFGATSVGTQFSVNDVTSGSIYMVNDISGLPIIEALSDWTVNMYNYPTRVFQKTGNNIIISGSLTVVTGSGIELQVTNTGVRMGNATTDVHSITGSVGITGSLIMSPTSSFVLPLTASVSPATGSAYWSGSFLFIYNGTRYMSASFA